MFAAACGVRARGAAPVRRALLPIALGHGASVALVVCLAAQGVLMNRGVVQRVAGALLVGAALWRLLRGTAPRTRDVGTRAGLALWSCLMATAHGAGLMLVPALVPLCMSDTPAREITATGSSLLMLAAVAVHLAAMLATTGVVAAGVCGGIARLPWRIGAAALSHAWTASLAVAGALLVALG